MKFKNSLFSFGVMPKYMGFAIQTITYILLAAIFYCLGFFTFVDIFFCMELATFTALFFNNYYARKYNRYKCPDTANKYLISHIIVFTIFYGLIAFGFLWSAIIFSYIVNLIFDGEDDGVFNP